MVIYNCFVISCKKIWLSSYVCFNLILLLLQFEEQKNKQILELQAGLDEADVVVMYLAQYIVIESLLALFFLCFMLVLCHQIRKMDLEARSLQPSLKAMLLAKLREYKSDLNKLKREVKKLTSAKSDIAAHEELLDSGMVDAHAVCRAVYMCAYILGIMCWLY